jgi:hypothetical protein
MSDSVFVSLLQQAGQTPRPGGRVFRDLLAGGVAHVDKINKIRGDQTLTSTGKAGKVADVVRTNAIPELKKASRQLAHMEKRFEIDSRSLRARVLGKSDEFDSERRMVLRNATPAERIRMCAEDEAMARAALRGGPTLSGIASPDLERFFEPIAEKSDPTGVEAQRIAADGIHFVKTAMEALTNTVRNSPGMINGNSLRPYNESEFAALMRSVEAPAVASVSEEMAAELPG